MTITRTKDTKTPLHQSSQHRHQPNLNNPRSLRLASSSRSSSHAWKQRKIKRVKSTLSIPNKMKNPSPRLKSQQSKHLSIVYRVTSTRTATATQSKFSNHSLSYCSNNLQQFWVHLTQRICCMCSMNLKGIRTLS